MKTLGRALLWVSGVIFIMFGLLLIVGVDADNMLWTIGSLPIGCGVVWVGYKFMVWSGFEEEIKDIKEA